MLNLNWQLKLLVEVIYQASIKNKKGEAGLFTSGTEGGNIVLRQGMTSSESREHDLCLVLSESSPSGPRSRTMLPWIKISSSLLRSVSDDSL